MKWKWIIGGAGGVALLAAFTRRQQQEHEQQRTAVGGLRRHFPRIARMRLVAACPDIERHLDDRSLEPVFDWMVDEMCRRSGACDFPTLLHWAVERGQPEMDSLSSDVTRDAVERLPRRALKVIDGCHGRTYAAAVFDLALSEAGQRTAPELRKQNQGSTVRPRYPAGTAGPGIGTLDDASRSAARDSSSLNRGSPRNESMSGSIRACDTSTASISSTND